MSNFDEFKNIVDEYLQKNGIQLDIISDLEQTSLNDAEKENPYYVYHDRKNLVVIDMDKIAQKGYKIIKNAQEKENIINTADAFLINNNNEWFFVEFKDTKLKADNSSLKNNVLKKAYSNWYMLLDILFYMRDNNKPYSNFSFDNPVKFAKEHVQYILVCSEQKNPLLVQQIKNSDLIGEKYTPIFMQRLKSYMFRDAYVYTETWLERKLVDSFTY